MISANRFIASVSQNKSDWLEARESAVTATTVARAATPRGFENETIHKMPRELVDGNAYIDFGVEMEPVIAKYVKDEFEIMPNDWLISASEDHGKYMATPDGLSLDHVVISEIKTTGKDWGELKNIPIHYRRQVQWQMYCTGALRCLFAWLLRLEVDGVMVPAWFEPKHIWIHRDEQEITKLKDVADRLLEWRKQNATVQPR